MSTPPQAHKRVTMRQAVRDRILLEVLGRAQGKNKPGEQVSEAARKRFVCVVDTRATRVLSAALFSHDLGEQGVAIVENLVKSRQPFPQLEAIYIIEPTVQNIEIIEKDFHYWDEPLYVKAHVFLTRKPSSIQDKNAVERLHESLRGVTVRRKSKAPAGKRRSRLANLIEANVDFLAVEDNAFHLDLPKALVQLFGPSDEHAVWCENRIVDGVASLCATLHEYPFVRYQANNALGESLATSLNTRVEALLADDKDFWYHGMENAGARGTLLFLDRRQDLASPLMHDFTYQALVYDLLESRDNLVRYVEPRKINETDKEYADRQGKPKKALLNESDPLWVQFRHSHITQVIEHLGKITKELRETTVGQYMEQGAQDTDLESMQAVVSEMQAFKEIMAKHTMHLAICQACMDKVANRNLIDESKLEQNVVTGVDTDGSILDSQTRMVNELATMMRRTGLTPSDKLRLACLHAVTLGQARQDVIQQLLRDADLPNEAQNALLGLRALGVSLIATGATTGNDRSAMGWLTGKNKPLPGMELETPYRSKEAIEKAVRTARAATGVAKTTRYSPLVKGYLESICTNRMAFEDFPFVKPPPLNSGLGGSPIDLQELRGAAHRVTTIDRSLSVRKHQASTASIEKKSTAAELDSLAQNKIVYQGGRIIVFIAGGVSYSELRAIHEVMRFSKREIIVGSTHFMRPEDLLHDLSMLADIDESRRYLEEDILEKKAEEFFLDEEDKKMLHGVLIDVKMDPEEMMKIQQEDEKIAQEEFKKNDQELGFIPMIVGYVPFCGKNLRSWLNGDDVPLNTDEEAEDDGIVGDIKRCSSLICPCLVKKTADDRAPLTQNGQSV